MRLGFLTHVHGPGRTAAAVYADLLEFFVAADELGLNSGWIAQHHLRDDYGRLPSPLVFLAGVAERTRTIRLGTGITVLPLEHPLRLAEDAAVLDALSAGRVELGLGTGGANHDAFAAFGVSPDDARAVFDEKLTALRAALRGPVVQPPAPGLADRLWVSTGSPERAAEVARNGDGLLLGTALHDPLTVQRPLVEAYRAAGGSRVGIVRAVFPAADKRAARDDLAPALAILREGARRRGDHDLASLDTDATLARLNVHHGHPEEIVESLRVDPALREFATDFLPVVSHEVSHLDDDLRRLELVVTKIAPAL